MFVQAEYTFPELKMHINIAKCEAADKRDCEGNFTHDCDSQGGKTWSQFNIHDDLSWTLKHYMSIIYYILKFGGSRPDVHGGGFLNS